MMKKGLLLPVAVSVAFSLFAQPILQNNVLPSTGDLITRYQADPLSMEPGKAGADQVWDFTHLKPLSGTNATQYEFVLPTNAPDFASFPTANLVYKTNAEQPTYAYYSKGNTQFTLLGVAEPNSLAAYNMPDLALQTPLRFHGTVQSDFASTTNVAANIFHSTGTRSATYDAYGTLKTPLGTFPNAMRMRYEASQVDSALQSDRSTIVNHTNTLIYDWFVAGQSDALVSLYYVEVSSEIRVPGRAPVLIEKPTYRGLNYISAATNSAFNTTDAPVGLTITALGPNPATEQLLVRFSVKTADQSLQLLITDATGKLVETRTIRPVMGENSLALPVSQLAAGSYFLTLGDGQKTVTHTWVKQ